LRASVVISTCAQKGSRKGRVPGGQRTPSVSGSDWFISAGIGVRETWGIRIRSRGGKEFALLANGIDVFQRGVAFRAEIQIQNLKSQTNFNFEIPNSNSGSGFNAAGRPF